jgi:glycosyltransferase involved in cell wall biosynthesis
MVEGAAFPARVALLTPVLAQHDAVGNDVLGMYEVLRSLGVDVRLFCETKVGLDVEAGKSREAPEFCDGDDACLIYHYSVGWDRGLEIVAACRGRKVLKYHNITPPHFYAPYSESYAAVCHAGREEMPNVARMPFDLFLGDSAYNTAELVDAGAPEERSGVVPPFHHVDELLTADAGVAFLERYLGGFNVLMVGRIAPNKGHPALVRVFADFKRVHRPDARLLIIGRKDARLAGYDGKIFEAIEETGVADSVHVLGGVGAADLKAAYLCADVFATMSEHEGFCVPVVEAMSMSVPVLGYGAAAVPETVGEAGLVWREDDPLLFSESLGELARDPELRRAMGDAGRARFEQVFCEGRVRDSFVEAMTRLVADGRR